MNSCGNSTSHFKFPAYFFRRMLVKYYADGLRQLFLDFAQTCFHAKPNKQIVKQRKENDMTENEISYKIIGAAIEVQKSIGTSPFCTNTNIS